MKSVSSSKNFIVEPLAIAKTATILSFSPTIVATNLRLLRILLFSGLVSVELIATYCYFHPCYHVEKGSIAGQFII
jgi:hypothetical protein